MTSFGPQIVPKTGDTRPFWDDNGSNGLAMGQYAFSLTVEPWANLIRCLSPFLEVGMTKVFQKPPLPQLGQRRQRYI